MRIWTGIRIYRAKDRAGTTRSMHKPLVPTGETREHLQRMLHDSVWQIGDLSPDDLGALLEHAKANPIPSHDDAAVRQTVTKLLPGSPRSHSLAVNMLILMSQFKHGEPLAEVTSDALIALRHSKGQGWGLINSRDNASNVRHLIDLVEQSARLQLMSKGTLNVTCFRYVRNGLSPADLDAANRNVLNRLQQEGIAIPSHTLIEGAFVIRVANLNHRSQLEDFDALVRYVEKFGDEWPGSAGPR